MRCMRRSYTIDLSALKPTVSFPHLPENTKTIDEVRRGEDRPGGHRFLHQRPDWTTCGSLQRC